MIRIFQNPVTQYIIFPTFAAGIKILHKPVIQESAFVILATKSRCEMHYCALIGIIASLAERVIHNQTSHYWRSQGCCFVGRKVISLGIVTSLLAIVIYQLRVRLNRRTRNCLLK